MEVGVRELKASLSAYIARAKKGEVVTVTERGRPVARLVPVGEAVPEVSPKLAKAIAEGKIIWSGKRLNVDELPPPIKLRGKGPTMAEIISENRD